MTGQEIPDGRTQNSQWTGSASIDAKSAAYKAMEEHFALADDLLGGTIRMRKAGVKWLPRFAGEEQQEYEWRIKNAVLRNILGRSADLLVGHMLREGLDKSELKLDEAMQEDFDKLGTSIDQYAAKVARYILTHGLAHTLTEFPKVEGERSLDDERTGGIRPYAILINPTDLWFSLPKYVNGVPVPIDVRWAVDGVEADGLGDRSYQEIRRLRIVQGDAPAEVKVGAEKLSFAPGAVVWEIWRSAGEGVNYGLVSAGELKGIDYIPLQTAYADFQGFMRSIPILDGVAQKNKEHWQASSDHNSIVQMSRFPMFYATGVTSDEVTKLNILGPHQKLASTNENAKFGYAEPSGAAVEQSFKDLERIAREADQESIEALYKAGSDTATGRQIDLIENMSPAQRCAKETERHVNMVLKDFSKRLGGRDLGMVKIDLDFGYSQNEQMMIDALQKARASGDIPRAYYLKRLQEFGPIGDDVNPEELAAEADNEQAERGLSSAFGQGNDQQGDDEEEAA